MRADSDKTLALDPDEPRDLMLTAAEPGRRRVRHFRCYLADDIPQPRRQQRVVDVTIDRAQAVLQPHPSGLRPRKALFPTLDRGFPGFVPLDLPGIKIFCVPTFDQA